MHPSPADDPPPVPRDGRGCAGETGGAIDHRANWETSGELAGTEGASGVASTGACAKQCLKFTGNTLEDNLLGLSPNNLRVVFTGIGYHSCACTLLGGLLGVLSRK